MSSQLAATAVWVAAAGVCLHFGLHWHTFHWLNSQVPALQSLLVAPASQNELQNGAFVLGCALSVAICTLILWMTVVHISSIEALSKKVLPKWQNLLFIHVLRSMAQDHVMVFFSRQMFVFCAHFFVFPLTTPTVEDISEPSVQWSLLSPHQLFDRFAPLLLHVIASLVWFASNTSLLTTRDSSWNMAIRAASSVSWIAGMAILRISSSGLGSAIGSFPQFVVALISRFPLPVLALGAFSALPGQVLKAKAVGGARGFKGMSKLLMLNLCHAVGTLWAQRAGRHLTHSIGSALQHEAPLPDTVAWSMRLLMLLVALAVGMLYTHGVYTLFKASPAFICEWSGVHVSSVTMKQGPGILASAAKVLSLFRGQDTPQNNSEGKHASASLENSVSWAQLHDVLTATHDMGRLLQGRERLNLALKVNAHLSNLLSDLEIGEATLEVILHSSEAPPQAPQRPQAARSSSTTPSTTARSAARSAVRGACLPCLLVKQACTAVLQLLGGCLGGRTAVLLQRLWREPHPTVTSTLAVIHIGKMSKPAAVQPQEIEVDVDVHCQLGRLLEAGRELRSLARVQCVQLVSTHASVFSDDVFFTVPLASITRSGIWSTFESTRMSVEELMRNTTRLSQFNAAVNAASSELLQEELDSAGVDFVPALRQLNDSVANLQSAAEAASADARRTRLHGLIGWSPALEVLVDAVLETMVALVAVKVQQAKQPAEKSSVFAAAVLKLAGALSSLTHGILLSAVGGMTGTDSARDPQHKALTSLGMALLMFALQALVFPDHLRKLGTPAGDAMAAPVGAGVTPVAVSEPSAVEGAEAEPVAVSEPGAVEGAEAETVVARPDETASAH